MLVLGLLAFQRFCHVNDDNDVIGIMEGQLSGMGGEVRRARTVGTYLQYQQPPFGPAVFL